MNVRLQLFQPLFLADAEMLLLVDDEQPEAQEGDVLGEERMGADDDVDAAFGQVPLDRRRLLRSDEAGQLLDAQRQPREALLDGSEMLAREQRGRHHDRDLRPGHGRDKRRAHRYLSLAETDIAANQAIHRSSRRHVAQRLENGALLVVGFGIGKARGEFLVEALGRRHGLALAQLALRSDRDQLFGDVLDPLLDPRLARLPRQSAQPVERHLGVLGAVARQHLDVLDRHEQLVVAGIKDAQAIMRRARHFERDKSVVAADAMLGMNDEVARRERGDFGDELVVIGAPPRRPGQPVA